MPTQRRGPLIGAHIETRLARKFEELAAQLDVARGTGKTEALTAAIRAWVEGADPSVGQLSASERKLIQLYRQGAKNKEARDAAISLAGWTAESRAVAQLVLGLHDLIDGAGLVSPEGASPKAQGSARPVRKTKGRRRKARG